MATTQEHTRNQRLRVPQLHVIGSKPTRVLLVDDAPENQFLISRILEARGFLVEIAVNGIEAVEKALARSYDVLLMDMHMPLLDGYEATRWLRDLSYRKPIIALTADSLPEDKKRVLAAGCDAHLSKPVDFAKLLATIEHFTRVSTAEKKRPGL